MKITFTKPTKEDWRIVKLVALWAIPVTFAGGVLLGYAVLFWRSL